MPKTPTAGDLRTLAKLVLWLDEQARASHAAVPCSEDQVASLVDEDLRCTPPAAGLVNRCGFLYYTSNFLGILAHLGHASLARRLAARLPDHSIPPGLDRLLARSNATRPASPAHAIPDAAATVAADTLRWLDHRLGRRSDPCVIPAKRAVDLLEDELQTNGEFLVIANGHGYCLLTSHVAWALESCGANQSAEIFRQAVAARLCDLP